MGAVQGHVHTQRPRKLGREITTAGIQKGGSRVGWSRKI